MSEPTYHPSQISNSPNTATMPPPHLQPAAAGAAAKQSLTLIVATTPTTSTSNAATRRLGIGHNGNLPWPRIKADMGFFARVTTRAPPSPTESRPAINAVIMGRKTYDSIPARFRPLPRRLNVIISRDQSGEVQRRVVEDWKAARKRESERERELAGKTASERQEQVEAEGTQRQEPEVLVSNSLESALGLLRSDFHSRFPTKRLGNIFVIGGAEIYASALRLNSEIALHYSIRILMTDVRRPRKLQQQEQGEPSEAQGLHSAKTATTTPTGGPTEDPSKSVDGFECSIFFPLSLDDIEGSREWREVDSSELIDWVGEEVPGIWKWENDIALRIRAWERARSTEEK